MMPEPAAASCTWAPIRWCAPSGQHRPARRHPRQWPTELAATVRAVRQLLPDADPSRHDLVQKPAAMGFNASLRPFTPPQCPPPGPERLRVPGRPPVASPARRCSPQAVFVNAAAERRGLQHRQDIGAISPLDIGQAFPAGPGARRA